MHDTRAASAFLIHGHALAGGIAIGRATVLLRQDQDIVRSTVPASQVGAELGRLTDAIIEVKRELQSLADQLPDTAPPEARALLQVHALMIDDPTLASAARARIADEQVNAEWAFATQAEQLVEQFESLDDAYLRERGRDVRQVAERVIKALQGRPRQIGAAAQAPADGAATIVVAQDISPADLLHHRDAAGYCIDLGSPASHAAIVARSFAKPALIGTAGAAELVREGDTVIVDGDAGVLIVAPDPAMIEYYRGRQRQYERESDRLRTLVDKPARTVDGVQIRLLANIELPGDAIAAAKLGAEGIGLFRSEFLFLSRTEPPTEDEQYEAYRGALRAMKGRPVTIRTFDLGADKVMPLPGARVDVLNPALGRRAIRYCLAEPELFLTQLRALWRASAHGEVCLLLPMLSHPHQLHDSLAMIARAREQLVERKQAHADRLRIGGMIEVPAAALMARWFARQLDFLSIGTNDLTQYALAIDRGDAEVSALYTPDHPAVLHLIAATIKAARLADKPVAVCGEMAGDEQFTEFLIGVGLREFSMDSSRLLRIKERIRATDAAQALKTARRMLRGIG